MDSEETTSSVTTTKKHKRVLSSLALRYCTVIVFSIISFVVLSFLLGILVIFIGELWVYSSSSSSASLHSRCKIVSSCKIKVLILFESHLCERFNHQLIAEIDRFLVLNGLSLTNDL